MTETPPYGRDLHDGGDLHDGLRRSSMSLFCLQDFLSLFPSMIATPQGPAEAGGVEPPEFTLEIGPLHTVPGHIPPAS